MKQVESLVELFQEGTHVNQTEKSTPFIFATGEILIDFFLLGDSGHQRSEIKFTTLAPIPHPLHNTSQNWK